MLNAEVYMDSDWTDGVFPDGRKIFFTVNGENLNAWKAAQYYCTQISQMGYQLEKDYSSNFAILL